MSSFFIPTYYTFRNFIDYASLLFQPSLNYITSYIEELKSKCHFKIRHFSMHNKHSFFSHRKEYIFMDCTWMELHGTDVIANSLNPQQRFCSRYSLLCIFLQLIQLAHEIQNSMFVLFTRSLEEQT